MKNIDIFDYKYTMSNLPSAEMCPESQQGMYETFGDDLKTVLKAAKSDNNTVWTAMDSESGLVLVNGYHLVNRVYYMITEECGFEDEEYLIAE